ncbi:MAG TPA: enolase C-terminal domain-like protein [Aestuariivirgaceae bacterium]|jgi:L-alanine-DL-glutamate epimerase-like enolase superfamily enzyme
MARVRERVAIPLATNMAVIDLDSAAYLHLAAATPALPHALDTHVTELSGDVVKEGVIGLTGHATMRVPDRPGLGVDLDPDRLAAAAHARSGDKSVFAEDESRAGTIPVKSML